MKTFNVYSSTKGKVRKDGSRLTTDKGCNGKEHAIFQCLLWSNIKGDGVVHGKFLRSYITGLCDGSCHSKGWFIIT